MRSSIPSTDAVSGAAIAAALHARAAQTAITQARVLEELALLAFSDITHYGVSPAKEVILVPGAPAGPMRAVQSIKRRGNDAWTRHSDHGGARGGDRGGVRTRGSVWEKW